jgi:uncharacterized membrane protein YoaK (UPF0700 family)
MTANPTLTTRTTTGSLHLALLLALAGGFLDAFTFVGHGGVFANAQTGNVVLLAVGAATGHWGAALRHVPPLLAFVAGVVTAETMIHPRFKRLFRKPARAALVAEIAVLAVIGAIPRHVGSTVVVLLVAYVAAVQSSAFGTVRRWSFNSAVTTANLRTATRAAYGALLLREPGAAEQARCFAAISFAFLAGASVGAFATHHLLNHAAWLAALLLSIALSTFVVDEWLATGGASPSD